MSRFAAAMLVALSLAPAAHAQDHAHDAAMPAIDLPAICLENAASMEGMAMAPHAMGGSPAHIDLMDAMDAMNNEMMLGGTATDIDVAFACAMIPHHRGAIDMAQALLDHGDDPWTRELAADIVAAQEQEIADMLAWLEAQPQP